ncbi:MAG: hypothetical protein F6K41_05220 [Symploca sp. SIO3E6]|nr:hypothetical protein [Caldora sp. SIO3E6]
MISVTFETPKHDLGEKVWHRFNSYRGEVVESGTILGYSWSMNGQLEAYKFAPDSTKSINYPCQPVGVETIL